MINIESHKREFENIYKILGDDERFNIKFPLKEIDKFQWNRGKWNDEFYNYHYRRFTSHILSSLKLMEGLNILIIGCGFGFDEKNIKSLFPTIQLWSLDISHEMLNRAINSKSPSNFSEAIAEALPFPDNCFDRVLSREVIEHVIDPQLMLNEIYRVLKPGGISVITTENEESWSPCNYYDIKIKSSIQKLLRLNVQESTPYQDESPSKDDMKVYIDNAGLSLQRIFYDGALYMHMPSMNSLFRAKMPNVAHYYSCLENNDKLAYAFCDQVKYIIEKPKSSYTSYDETHDVYYACVKCKARLNKVENAYSCQSCKISYTKTNNILNFIPYNTIIKKEQERNMVDHSVKKDALFRRIRLIASSLLIRILRKIYIIIYLLAATICTIFTKKNKNQLSHVLHSDDPYLQYLKLI